MIKAFLNPFPQTLQGRRFSDRWVSRCFFWFEIWLKVNSQSSTGQRKGRSPVWILRWSNRLCHFLKSLLQDPVVILALKFIGRLAFEKRSFLKGLERDFSSCDKIFVKVIKSLFPGKHLNELQRCALYNFFNDVSAYSWSSPSPFHKKLGCF